jgi:hypothetical protein
VNVVGHLGIVTSSATDRLALSLWTKRSSVPQRLTFGLRQTDEDAVRVYRSRYRVLFYAIGGAVICAMWWAAAVDYVSSDSPSATPRGVGAFVLFAVGLAGLALCARAGRAGARLTESGVEVVGFRGRRSIAWKDISHFDLGPHDSLHPRVARLWLQDGSYVPIVGVTARGENPLMPTDTQAAALVADLNQAASAHR